MILCLALGLGQVGTAPAAAADQENLENLKYRLSLGFWQDVARVHLRLIRVGPERYRAEFSGAAQGAWSLLKRWLPESYESEMALEGGRLKPLLYREKFHNKGQHISKEYRFDYARGVLEIWRGVDGRKPVLDWQGPLKEPVYDPLTLFYNLRLGALGPVTPGKTLTVALIPNPEPREMVVSFGPETAQGRKVMVSVKSGAAAEDGPYFIFANPQKVPLLAWVRVLVFGKLSGQLLNPGEIMKEGLPAPSQLSRHGGENR
ncbi:MAG: DUF3108 domain-containing protein [Deltaproteobacteria bacterium]|nr:DUF3108 domain-containing protein [Deltaproteobacteria bacterium]